MAKWLYGYLFILIITFFGGYFYSSAQVPEAKAQDAFEQCMGEALARYVEAVMAQAGGLRNIHFLMPAFNMTNPAELRIYDVMMENCPSCRNMDLAGNVYTYPNIPATQFMQEWIAR